GVDAEERRPPGGRRALRLQVDEDRSLAPGTGRRAAGAGLAPDAPGEELPLGGREGFQRGFHLAFKTFKPHAKKHKVSAAHPRRVSMTEVRRRAWMWTARAPSKSTLEPSEGPHPCC